MPRSWSSSRRERRTPRTCARKAAFNNAPSQLTTDGNTQYSNEFSIDGIPNTFAAASNPRVAFSPPQSALGEFRVQTSTYDAAFGPGFRSLFFGFFVATDIAQS